MKHPQEKILIASGETVMASAPIIISASRATDIPAFYSDWFFNRLDKGYAAWRNPFSGQKSYVSFNRTRFIVFWSKNPASLLSYIARLKERGMGCYVQYTLNDYQHEGLEPNIPDMDSRIDIFKSLVKLLGKGAVVWRYDPLILTGQISIPRLLDKITHIADRLHDFTEKLVFSFADICSYKKVGRNLSLSGIDYKEWDEASMREFALRLSELNRNNWGLELSTCAEAINLEEFGIMHNRCIDPELIQRLSADDEELIRYLKCVSTDKGQRKFCGCVLSKDIGTYNTCPHGCLYCYANNSPASAMLNYHRHQANPFNETII